MCDNVAGMRRRYTVRGERPHGSLAGEKRRLRRSHSLSEISTRKHDRRTAHVPLIGSPPTAPRRTKYGGCVRLPEESPACVFKDHCGGAMYLGGRVDAGDYEKLQQNQITHILNCTTSVKNKFEKNGEMKYHRLPIVDDEWSNASKHFEEACEWLHHQLQKGRAVLVHCQEGVSRAPTFVLAYLMKHKRWPLRSSLSYLIKIRDVVHPNEGFLSQLATYEIQCLGGSSIRKLKQQLYAGYRVKMAVRGAKDLDYTESQGEDRGWAACAII